MRVEDACSLSLPLTHKRANQELLSRLLRRKAEMYEVPVHFYSVSPHQVKRTTVLDGLQVDWHDPLVAHAPHASRAVAAPA